MSSADCPKCSGPRDAKALYCPFCGVIFARFAAESAAAPVMAPVVAPIVAPAVASNPVFAPAQSYAMTPALAGGAFDDTFPLPPAQTVYGGPAPAAPQGSPEGWNPYQSPNATPAAAFQPAAVEDFELATRGSRLAAQLLNGLGMMLITLIVCCAGLLAGVPLAVDNPSDVGLMGCVAVASIIWGAINLRQLSLTSQSVGKKAMKIRILKANGERPTMLNLTVARYLSMQVLGAVPVAGPFFGLIDTLMIFGVEQRCLHDRIAGTVVVKA